MIYPQAQKFEMREAPRWCTGSSALGMGVVLVPGVGAVLVPGAGVGVVPGAACGCGAECAEVSIGDTGAVVVSVSAR